MEEQDKVQDTEVPDSKQNQDENQPEPIENKATEDTVPTNVEKKEDTNVNSLADNVKEMKVSDEDAPEPPKMTGFSFWKKEGLPNVKECWEKEAALSEKERRQRYKCKNKFVKIDDIPSWTVYSKNLTIDSTKFPPKVTPNDEINSKIALYHGDITVVEADAIVNAANSSCLGGGGIDGAIHRAAGDRLYQECRTLNGCQTGHAKITRGYNLPAKFVIHAVGPIGEDKEALTSCYENSLKLVLEHNIKTIVFCGISSGIYGYPVPKAANIALSTVRNWLEVEDNRKRVDKIVFCTFLKHEKVAYDVFTPVYYPK